MKEQTLDSNLTHLLDKFASNQLTPAELAELKGACRKMNDKGLKTELEKVWTQDSVVGVNPPQELYDRLMNEKFVFDHPQRRKVSRLWLGAGGVAAALLLGVLLYSTHYFYQQTKLQSELLAQQEVRVVTQRGERTQIVLPDGTNVRLNPNSELRYSPLTFINQQHRQVELLGDAYFEVVANTESPFVVQTQQSLVRVLGTKFWLSDRASDSTVTVGLDQGRVLFSSRTSLEDCLLDAGQYAVLNKNTNHIAHNQVEKKRLWVNPELNFNKATLGEVACAVGRHYGVEIILSTQLALSDDQFSGAIPTDNLSNAIQVLEHTYGIAVKWSGSKVLLSGRTSSSR